MRKGKKRIVIIIDDIDRLANEEIRLLFRLIKSVADFPNIVYFLAFDMSVVSKALDSVYSTSGLEYLEKIIQAPFHLPYLDKRSIGTLLFDRLDKILAGIDEDSFDLSYWAHICRDGIIHLIDTPRDVIRYTNALSVTYPPIKEEVNPVDFVALECLRILIPDAYQIIRNNESCFIGSLESEDHSVLHDLTRDENGLKEFHQQWLIGLNLEKKKRQAVENIVRLLFPNCFKFSTEKRDWKKKLRICHSDIFSIYFQYTLSGTRISQEDIELVVQSVGNEESFRLILLKSNITENDDRHPKSYYLLDRFIDCLERIEDKHIPNVLKVLYEIGDLLIEDECTHSHFMLEMGNLNNLWFLTKELLSRYEEQKERLDIFLKAFSDSASIYTLVHIIVEIEREHEKYYSNYELPDDLLLFSEENLSFIESFAVKKIRESAQSNKLIDLSNFCLMNTLCRWRDWGEKEEPSKWLSKFIECQENLVKLLIVSIVTSTETYYDGEKQTKKKTENICFSSLKDFINIDVLYEKVKKITNKQRYSEREQYAIKLCIERYEELKERKESTGIDD